MTQTVTPTLNTDSHLKTPLGPRGHWLLGHVHDMQHDTLNFLSRLAHEYGDVARIRRLFKSVYVVSHPDGIRQVFQKNHFNYDRNNYKPLRSFLGNGLPLSDGAFWQRQRRLMQPAFHRQRIADMATQMVKAGDDLLKLWEKRANQDEPLDMHQEMKRVTLCIVGITLFSLDLTAENPMGQAFKTLVQALAEYFFFPFPPLSVPTLRNRRIQATLNRLNTLVYDLIGERREQKTEMDDLLSLLLASDEDGSGMIDQQLRDEMLSLFFAGHETAANTLTWALYELSQHPEVEHRLWQEIETVLHGKHPTVADLPQLPYARMVIDETLRLYPPVSVLTRHALADDNICGYHIPAHSEVTANIYAVHRHLAYWEQPEIFNPDRFLPDNPCEGARTAYLPFGSGPHLCIGKSFALMETQILLTMIVQRYQLQLAPGPTVEPVLRLTVHPRHGLPMFLKARK